MTNWRKIIETNPVFNLILRKTIDAYPGKDIRVQFEGNTHTKKGSISLRPGHEWLFTYKKKWRKEPQLTWAYRLKRKSATRDIGYSALHLEWIIEASVLTKIFVNEWKHPDENTVIRESWSNDKRR